MRNEVTILESKLHDVCELAENLRKEHVDEVLRSGSKSQEKALVLSYGKSTYCFTVLIGNKVSFMYGVVEENENLANIWALGSSLVDSVPIQFARLAKEIVIPLFLKKYKVLYNYIDAEYSKGIKFIEFLGGKIDYNSNRIINDNRFLYFEIKE